jgi:hypothetical protein
MACVRAAAAFPGSVHEAESCWYDVARWPAFIEGLERVVAVEGGWPGGGGVLRWESVPAGRGRVTERVLSYEPLVGQTVELEDDSIRGRQTVAFAPVDRGVEVQLSLDYAIKGRSLITPLVDLLFIRRAMAASLQSTLTRFGAELAAARRANVG